MQESVDVSILILSWNTSDLLRSCLRSLMEDSSRRSREILVVDNASSDDSVEMVRREFPDVVLIENDENLLYSEANNLGAQKARGRFLCVLNSDTEVRPGAIDTLVDFLEESPSHAVVGPKLLNTDGTIQGACARFPRRLDAFWVSTIFGRFPPGRWLLNRAEMAEFDHQTSRDVEQIMGACLVFHREEYLDVGGFDPELGLYFNDHDLCKRLLERGRPTRFLPTAEVVHHRGESVKKYPTSSLSWSRNRYSYYRKHLGVSGALFVRIATYLSAFETTAGILLSRKKRWSEKKSALRELVSFTRKVFK